MQSHRTRIIALHLFFFFFTVFSFRHFFEEGDHLWTGEGARLSWSMRLKGKVCDYGIKLNGGEWKAPDFSVLSIPQKASMDDPYFFLQYVRTTQCQPGQKVFANVVCRAVSRVPAPLIHSDVDLCTVDYSFVTHNSWIYPNPGPLDPDYRKWFETSGRVHKQ